MYACFFFLICFFVLTNFEFGVKNKNKRKGTNITEKVQVICESWRERKEGCSTRGGERNISHLPLERCRETDGRLRHVLGVSSRGPRTKPGSNTKQDTRNQVPQGSVQSSVWASREREGWVTPQRRLRPNPMSTPYPFPLPLQNKGEG
ncbi:unnamed protein product [Arctogadus glacialis]